MRMSTVPENAMPSPEIITTCCRYRLHIVGEVSMDVQHCLVACPGVKKEDVKRVMSHPNALAQCSSYLHGWPGVVRETASDTAAAAKAVAQQGLRWGRA